MKLTCSKDNLRQGVATVRRAINNRNTLPICDNILLEAQDNQILLTGTNLETTIMTRIPAVIDREGSVTLPNRLFAEYIGTIAEETINLDSPEEKAYTIFTAGGHTATIHGANPEDYPPRPTVNEGIAGSVEAEEFGRALNRVVGATAKEESRPALTGVNIRTSGPAFKVAAADGFQLAVDQGDLLEPPAEDLDVIIKANTIHEIIRNAQGATEPVRFLMVPERHQALFMIGRLKIFTQLIDQAFPNTEKLIPTTYSARMVVATKDFNRAAKTAALFAKDDSKIIRMRTQKTEGLADPGVGQLTGRSDQIGETSITFRVKEYEGDNAKVALNGDYMLEIGDVAGDDVEIRIDRTDTPVVIGIPGSEHYHRVIMPMFTSWPDEGPIMVTANGPAPSQPTAGEDDDVIQVEDTNESPEPAASVEPDEENEFERSNANPEDPFSEPTNSEDFEEAEKEQMAAGSAEG